MYRQHLIKIPSTPRVWRFAFARAGCFSSKSPTKLFGFAQENLMKCKCCTCCRMQVKWPSISEYLRALLVFPWDSLTFWAFRNQKQQAPNSSWRCDGCYLSAASLQPAAMPQKWWHLLDDCGASATGRCARVGFVSSLFNHVTWQILRFDHVSLGCPPSRCRSTRFAAFPMQKLLLEHCAGVRRCHWSLGKGFVPRLLVEALEAWWFFWDVFLQRQWKQVK